MIRVLALAVFLAALALTPASPASAEIEVRSQPVPQNVFPDGVRFTIFLASNADITRVRLFYRVLPYGPLANVNAQCSQGATVSCTANLTKTVAYMPPGTDFIYYWEVEDAAGQRLTTPQGTYTYEDIRFSWQAAKEGNVTVNFYFGDDQTVQSVMRVARETIDKFTKLEGTQADFPVKIWVYQLARDLQPAASSRPGDEGHLLGQLSASDTVLVSRDTDFLNVVRHEVTHAVTARATRGHIGELPTWINEGLSTYSQSQLLPGEQQAFDIAVRSNRVLPITSLQASTRSSAVSLFYAQSGSIVKYLIDAQGEAKFAQFIAAHANDTTNNALQKVYGFDLLGLEDKWRASLGLPPVSGGNANRAPTRAPAGNQGGSAPAPATAKDEGGGSSSLVLIVAAVLGVALIGGAGVYYVLSSRGSKPSA